MRFLLVSMLLASCGWGGGAAERRDWQVPPPGIQIAESDRGELSAGVTRLGERIEHLRTGLKPPLQSLLPDVEVFHKAVSWALLYGEFYRSNEVAAARLLLRRGLERVNQLQAGSAPWLTATGLVVRGYVSKLDGSVQPYGLVVPSAAYDGARHRVDVWLHGRDDRLTELKFISDRMRSPGQFTPPDTLVLHPYGRFCNAFKFAGEMDVMEALDHVKTHYAVDTSRLAVRGFSMGGAGCWHLAVHHAGMWAGAAPGAGFAETAEYSGILRKEPSLPWYEQRLWRWYDATDYAINLFHCPTIAYSGELDKQKQAADMMERAMAREGLSLPHVIGPNTGHQYEPGAKADLERRFDEIMRAGGSVSPRRVKFSTWTLRYNRMHWLALEGMERHWERARIEVEPVADVVAIKTENVTAFSVAPSPLFGARAFESLEVDGDLVKVPRLPARIERVDGRWSYHEAEGNGGSALSPLVKRPGLQGPIDDAFMGSFLMVRPTGEPWNEVLGAWVAKELTHATNEWRAQFRGYARVTDDSAVTDADISEHNLILWGDPRSNLVLARVVGLLPLDWTPQRVRVGGEEFDSSGHVPVLVFPNPLNPDRYIVINSGFTFCEFGKLSNSLQTPKLPDWAILDMRVSIGKRHEAGAGVAAAGFFGERWEIADRN